MRIILAICLIISLNIGFSQKYKDYCVKEEYDYFNRQLIAKYHPQDSIHNLNDVLYGDGMAHILEGYLTMYETTKDKAYLYKYLIQSLNILKNRHDFRKVDSNIPRWDNTPSSLYLTGNTLAALARFVYFVKNDTVIENTKIYPLKEIEENPFDIKYETFGTYANWLQTRCEETIHWFLSNGYWSEDGFIKEGDRAPAELNQQVGFGRSLLYIGLAANDSNLLSKAKIIADHFKGRVYIRDKCFGKPYNQPVFQLSKENGYFWYHAGWRTTHYSCNRKQKNLKIYQRYIEDISHGVHDIWLANDFYHYQPKTPFLKEDLIRFRNTFTKHIYDKEKGFHNNVLGTDENFYCGDNCQSEGLKPNFYKYEFTPLSYAFLSDYDDKEATLKTYSIVMDFYQRKILNKENLSGFYGGQANKAHAELVEQQWKNENFTLHLYKRRLVYDQDFHAKNTLVISPTESEYPSYAEPQEDQFFIVTKGVKSNLTSNNEIILKSGVEFKAGSEVTLSIKK